MGFSELSRNTWSRFERTEALTLADLDHLTPHAGELEERSARAPSDDPQWTRDVDLQDLIYEGVYLRQGDAGSSHQDGILVYCKGGHSTVVRQRRWFRSCWPHGVERTSITFVEPVQRRLDIPASSIFPIGVECVMNVKRGEFVPSVAASAEREEACGRPIH